MDSTSAKTKMAAKQAGHPPRQSMVTQKLLLLGVLVVFSVLTLRCFIRSEEEPYAEDDDTFQRMVRSLHNGQQDKQEEIRKEEIRRYVEDKFPWIKQNNSLGNYFLNGAGIQPNRAEYRTGAIVFLHQHRAAGTAFTNCLSNISRTHNFIQAASFTSKTRHTFENSSTISQDDFERIKIITGQFSFGLCNRYKRQCSSFTVFRDPLQSAVSSYEYCKVATADEYCRVVNANTVSLRTWILHHGSTVFNALTFTAEHCNTEASTPCWEQHKSNIDVLSTEEHEKLLQYILNNMESWFSVIGLFEELPETVAMLEKAHLLPFSTCNVRRTASSDPDTILDAVSKTISNTITHSRKYSKPTSKFRMQTNNMDANKANIIPDLDSSIENEYNELRHDYAVRQTLEADYKLYFRARQIFDRQKEMLYNVVL